MQHSQQRYGSRLRAFQAQHGITDSRGTQPPAAPRPITSLALAQRRAAPPSPWRFLLGLGITALFIASAAVWVMACWASQGLEAVTR